MGTNLEDTIKDLERTINYYKECCNPINKDEIDSKLEELTNILMVNFE